jgi:hypothetical protein
MITEIHYPLAYFYGDTFQGECTFEVSLDERYKEEQDIKIDICSVVAYCTDLEIELEHVLTDAEIEQLRESIYWNVHNSDLHDDLLNEAQNYKQQMAYDNGKNSRREF